MRRNFLMAACLVLLSGSLASAGDRGQLVPVSQLPEAIFKSVTTAASDVTWLVSFRFDAENAADKTWYRAVGRDKKQSRLVKVMVWEGGEVIDVRTEIPMEEAPLVVRAAVKNRFPAYTAKSVEAVGKTMNSTIYYRFEGEMAGSKCAICSRADGTKVFQEGK